MWTQILWIITRSVSEFKIPYGRQEITEVDIAAVSEVLRSDYLTQGPVIHEFEVAFASYVGAKYAVAVANGTAALHLAAMALDVTKDTNVITSPITFAASANCIHYCGGTVTFADIDPSTGLLDIEAVRNKLASSDPGTFDGIIPVDFAGQPVDIEAFRKLADEYDLWVLEDACHAPGGYFHDSTDTKQLVGNGNFADLAIFSFHPVKHIAAGEGGMITTNSERLYERLLQLRTHGITKDPERMTRNEGAWYYEMQFLGYNYRLTDFQSALGLSQLKRAAENLAKRKEIALKYDRAFAELSLQTLNIQPGFSHAYHLYVILCEQRDRIFAYLRAQGIFVQVHYIPVHFQPFYQEKGFRRGDFPHAEEYYKKTVSLPMYPSLTDEEQDFVIEKVRESLQQWP